MTTHIIGQSKPRYRWSALIMIVAVLGSIVTAGCITTPNPINQSAVNTTPTPHAVLRYNPAIAAGWGHSLALRENGTVVGWRITSQGMGDMNCPYAPADLTNVTALATGYEHVIALLENGTVVGWGNTAEKGVYGVVPPGLTNVTAISAGDWSNLALFKNGSVVAWDADTAEILRVPTDLGNVTAISGGFGHHLALLENGTVVSPYCNVPSGLTNVTAISTDDRFNILALLKNGSVVVWNYGEYCDRPLKSVSCGLTNVTAISVGDGRCSVLLENHTVIQWPDTNLTAAEAMPGITNVTAIAEGFGHTLVLFENKTACDTSCCEEWGRGLTHRLACVNLSYNDPGNVEWQEYFHLDNCANLSSVDEEYLRER